MKFFKFSKTEVVYSKKNNSHQENPYWKKSSTQLWKNFSISNSNKNTVNRKDKINKSKRNHHNNQRNKNAQNNGIKGIKTTSSETTAIKMEETITRIVGTKKWIGPNMKEVTTGINKVMMERRTRAVWVTDKRHSINKEIRNQWTILMIFKDLIRKNSVRRDK